VISTVSLEISKTSNQRVSARAALEQATQFQQAALGSYQGIEKQLDKFQEQQSSLIQDLAKSLDQKSDVLGQCLGGFNA
jgi:predicted  nucleic acid-binding Zn-ribbon protein